MTRPLWFVKAVVLVGFAGICGYVAAKQPASRASSVVAAPRPVAPKVRRASTQEPKEPPALVPVTAAMPEESAHLDAPACPRGMVLVDGEYCPSVGHRCLRYLSQKRDRCAEYEAKATCYGVTTPIRFCIDQYEFPNQRGQKPVVGVTFEEAEESCKVEGKRLCEEREWTLACEGPDRTPYPTGYKREEGKCNYDRPYIVVDENRLATPATRDLEMARLDQRAASGEYGECVSATGVHDLTGNVDEWVLNVSGTRSAPPYQSGLKGGYWGPVRNRCRPMTSDHNEWHSGYQIGFRCCADAPETDQALPAGEGSPETPQATNGAPERIL